MQLPPLRLLHAFRQGDALGGRRAPSQPQRGGRPRRRERGREGGEQGGEEAAQEGRRRAGGREATQEEAAGAERGEEPWPPRPLHWLRPRERGAPRAGAQIKTAPGDTTLSGQNFPSPAPALFKDFFPSLALFFLVPLHCSPLLSLPSRSLAQSLLPPPCRSLPAAGRSRPGAPNEGALLSSHLFHLPWNSAQQKEEKEENHSH